MERCLSQQLVQWSSLRIFIEYIFKSPQDFIKKYQVLREKIVSLLQVLKTLISTYSTINAYFVFKCFKSFILVI